MQSTWNEGGRSQQNAGKGSPGLKFSELDELKALFSPLFQVDLVCLYGQLIPQHPKSISAIPAAGTGTWMGSWRDFHWG